jgi:hypothetical protein
MPVVIGVFMLILGCGGDPGVPWVTSGGRQTFADLGTSTVLPSDWVVLYDSNIPEIHIWNAHKDFSKIPIETITIEPIRDQFPADSVDALGCNEWTESGRTLAECVSTVYSSGGDAELTQFDFYLNLYREKSDGREYSNYHVRCQTPTDSLDQYEQVFRTAAESFRLAGQ